MSKKEHQQNLLRKLKETSQLESQVNAELESLKISYNKAMEKVRDFLPEDTVSEISSKFDEIVWNPERVVPGISASKLWGGISIVEQYDVLKVLEQDTIIKAKASKFVTQHVKRHVTQIQSQTKLDLCMSLKSELYDVIEALDAIKDAEDIHQLIATLSECTKAFDALTKALTLES